MSKLKGSVKFYNSEKGFGFVSEKETGKEYFVHATSLVDKIYENDEVSFDLVEGKKGLACSNVEVIG